jgi:hypothetical protein
MTFLPTITPDNLELNVLYFKNIRNMAWLWANNEEGQKLLNLYKKSNRIFSKILQLTIAICVPRLQYHDNEHHLTP